MRRHIKQLCVVPVAWAMFAATAANAEVSPLQFENHPLVGTIWQVADNQRLSRAQLRQKLAAASYVLLGEKHDNVVHHRHQAWVIRQLAAVNKSAGVAFEMIDTQQAEAMQAAPVDDVDGLIELLESTEPGWDYRRYYQPVLQAVLDAGLAIYPANLPKQTIRRVPDRALEVVPAAVQRLLKAAPLDDEQLQDQNAEIQRAHCDMLGEKMLPAMSRVQRVRDAMMAHSLMRHAEQHSQMVLIAGAGHVRADRAVPFYLRGQDPQAAIFTLAWVEVDEGKTQLGDYTSRWNTPELPFDAVWFTPRAQRPDPCQGLRERLAHPKGE